MGVGAAGLTVVSSPVEEPPFFLTEVARSGRLGRKAGVYADQPFRMFDRQPVGDERADVAAVRGERS
jgi:hypothetical protein